MEITNISAPLRASQLHEVRVLVRGNRKIIEREVESSGERGNATRSAGREATETKLPEGAPRARRGRAPGPGRAVWSLRGLTEHLLPLRPGRSDLADAVR